MLSILTSLYLFIGSYAAPTDEGVKVFSFDEDNGSATYVCGSTGISNPSFLCLVPGSNRLYSVAEGEGQSAAYSLTFDADARTLDIHGSSLTHRGAPCNICISPDGREVLTANYMGASVTAFPILPDGTLGEGRVAQFEGSSADAARQNQPHLHAVNFTPDGRYLLANDLGTDRIHIYPQSAGQSSAIDATYTDLVLPGGTGPRHLCFSADGSRAYIISEISGEVFTLAYTPGKKVPFKVIQTLKADPNDAEGSADIHLSPDGRFLYASHRLKGDGVSIFSVGKDGKLSPVGYQPTGIHPRNFAITPNGRYLLVACRDTNAVEIYERDAATGLLTDTHRRIYTQRPVCLLFK